jgi:hypothetical protein
METVENQTAGFPRFPQPLGNRKHRDSHIPPAPTTSDYFLNTKNALHARAQRALAANFTTEERSNPRHPNQDRICVRFQAHAALESNPTFRLIVRWNQNSISGSFLNWKMLCSL